MWETEETRPLGLAARGAMSGGKTRLGPQSILHQHGCFILASPSPSSSCNSSSWFTQVRDLCSMYCLPDPFYVLHYPEAKRQWKKTVKLRVVEYWDHQLWDHAAGLQSSLPYFRASHMFLVTPSPLWTFCRGLQYEVRRATVQTRMVSGRYRTCWLRRHWTAGESGACRVPGCTGNTPGTLLHLATGQCPGLTISVRAALHHWRDFVSSNPLLLPILQEYAAGDPEVFLSFLLDPITQSPVIALARHAGSEVIDQLCHLTRTWLYQLHKERLEKLGLWHK